MSRRKDLTDMADDYYEDDGGDDDMEYFIQDIQSIMGKEFKWDVLENLIYKFDWDQEAIIDHLLK